jgi:hypothetical protein
VVNRVWVGTFGSGTEATRRWTVRRLPFDLVGAAMRPTQLWTRMSKAQRVLSIIALGLISSTVFCCGGLSILGAIVGPASSKSPQPKPSATRTVEAPAAVLPSLTESPSPTASPTQAPSPLPPTTQVPAPPPPPPVTTTEAAPPPAPPTPAEVYYANCAAVRAAGAAPLYEGQPGYRSALDRDHDGVACE